MANLTDVVNECLVVSTAFNDISSDTYNEVGAVNYEDNDKDFPLFLFNKRNITAVVNKYVKSSNLASQTTYSCQLHFMDTYTETEKVSTDLQTKQGSLMSIADKYFAELKTRNESGTNGFIVGDITFNSFDETHNERLVEVSYNVDFVTYIEDCSTGTFDYGNSGIGNMVIETTFIVQ